MTDPDSLKLTRSNNHVDHTNPIPTKASPTWLERLANRRRGSCNFSDDHGLENGGLGNSNSPQGYGLKIPRPLVNTNNSMIPTASPSTPGNFRLLYPPNTDESESKNDVNLTPFLESGENRRLSLAKTEFLAVVDKNEQKDVSNLVKTIRKEDFSVLSVKKPVAKSDEHEEEDVMDSLDVYDHSHDDANRVAEFGHQPNQLTQAVMNSKWAQNWFFQNEETSGNPGNHRPQLDENPMKPNLQKRNWREMNFWSPQNL